MRALGCRIGSWRRYRGQQPPRNPRAYPMPMTPPATGDGGDGSREGHAATAEPASTGSGGRVLAGPHPVIARVVLDLGQAEHFQDRRHVVAEPAAEPFLQAVPAANRVVGRPAPGLDGAVGCLLLLVGVAQRHPVAALLQHRLQVLDAAKLVAQLRGANPDHQGRTIVDPDGYRLGLSPRALGSPSPPPPPRTPHNPPNQADLF